MDERVKRILKSTASSSNDITQTLELFTKYQSAGGVGADLSNYSLEQASMQLLNGFIRELKPFVNSVQIIVDNVDHLSVAVNEAQSSIMESAREADVFVQVASSLREKIEGARNEMERVELLTNRYQLTSDQKSLISTSPDDKSISLFLSLLSDLEERRRSLSNDLKDPDIVRQNILLRTLADHAEQLNAAELDALEKVYEWCLQTSSTLSQTQLSNGAVDPVAVNLGRCITVLSSRAPHYLHSCRQSFVHSRRVALTEAFKQGVTQWTDDSGVESEELLCILFARLHGLIAEEASLQEVLFPASSTSLPEGGVVKGGQGLDDSTKADENGEIVDNYTSLGLLAESAESIASPLLVRICLLLDDISTLPGCLRVLDVLLFYHKVFKGLLCRENPDEKAGGRLLATVSEAVLRCRTRSTALLHLLCERMKELPKSHFSSLRPSSEVTDCAAEIYSVAMVGDGDLSGILSAVVPLNVWILRLTEAFLLYSLSCVNILPSLPNTAAAEKNTSDPLSSEVHNAIEPEIMYAGVAVPHVIWMLNALAHTLALLSPAKHTQRSVEFLAAHLSAWENSAVSAFSDAILREAAVLSALANPSPQTLLRAASNLYRTLMFSSSSESGSTVAGSGGNRRGNVVLAFMEDISQGRIRRRVRLELAAVLDSAVESMKDVAMQGNSKGEYDEALQVLNKFPASVMDTPMAVGW